MIDLNSGKTHLQDYVNTHLTKSKGAFYQCPFCGSGTSGLPQSDGAFSLNPATDHTLWKCFSCDRGGDLYDLVAQLEGISLKDAFEKIQQDYAIAPLEKTGKAEQRKIEKNGNPPKDPQAKAPDQAKAKDTARGKENFFYRPLANQGNPRGEIQHQEKKQGHEEMPEKPEKQENQAISKKPPECPTIDFSSYLYQCTQTLFKSRGDPLNYLLGRGFTEGTIAHCNLGVDGGFITIPYNPRGSYFIKRVYEKNTKFKGTYLKPKRAEAGEEPVFNEDALYSPSRDPVFVTESPLCAISIMQEGGQAIALGGTASRKLISLLDRKPSTKMLILSLDNDKPGEEATAQLLQQLNQRKQGAIAFNVSGVYKDPNDHLKASREGLRGLIGDCLQKVVVEKRNTPTFSMAYEAYEANKKEAVTILEENQKEKPQEEKMRNRENMENREIPKHGEQHGKLEHLENLEKLQQFEKFESGALPEFPEFPESPESPESPEFQAVQKSQESEEVEATTLQNYQKNHLAKYAMEDFFKKIKERARERGKSTGFPELDVLLDGGLYEGLYVLGAISSLGKTTFSLQVADFLAKQGNDVLFFSLEMAKTELMAKSISRETYGLLEGNHTMEKIKKKNFLGKTTREITVGKTWEIGSPEEIRHLNKAMKTYENYSQNIYFFQGIGEIGTDYIETMVQKHIDLTGRKPTVFIDYLQILAPISERATDKQNTDKATLALKRLSRDHSLSIWAISSFNRENYTAPVNTTSFKESGAIEYSSDVLLALQYQGMDYEKNEKDNQRVLRIREEQEKREEALTQGFPIGVELKVLKNRNGQKGKTEMAFYPPCNHFKEQKKESQQVEIL